MKREKELQDSRGNIVLILSQYRDSSGYLRYDVYCPVCGHIRYNMLKGNLFKRGCYYCRKIIGVLDQVSRNNKKIKTLDPQSSLTTVGKRKGDCFEYYCNQCGTRFYTRWNGKQKLHCPICSSYIRKNIFQAYQDLTKHWEHYIIVNKLEYINENKPLLIQCTRCGYQRSISIHNASHSACPRCMGNIKRTLEDRQKDVFQKSKGLVHIDKLKEGIGEFACVEGHHFETKVNTFLMGSGGCPVCFSSKGELHIYQYLIEKGISFKRQVWFSSCRDKLPLPFDFCVDNHILIEYDGEQHFHPVKLFNKTDPFEDRVRRDNIKTKWAKQHGYELIRIPYTLLDNIPDILDNIFK